MRKITRKSRDIIDRDSKVISSLTRPYELVIDHADGSTIYDVEGNSYIDFASSVAVMNIGYNNKEFKEAVCAQMDKIVHCGFSDFNSEMPVKLAEKLCRMTGYEKLFFSNSGAETVEAAMKLAFRYTKRSSMLAFYRAFHGRTLGALSLTSSKVRHKEHYPSLRVVHSYYAYCYRCPFNLEYPDCGITCAREIEFTTFKRVLSPDDTAAIAVEPIQGEGGFIVPPSEFHKELRRICDENDILLIADEVQSGGFRTGKFMAMENFGVRADIVCMSKSIGSGIPLGATLSTGEIMSWPPGAHANTFGGNLLAAAGGLATLEFMESNRLGEKAVEKGTYLMKRLNELKDEYRIIGDVRGIGLMIGVELVEENKAPAVEKREKIVKKAVEEGLILLPAGDSVIRFVPPLIISKEEIDCGLEMFETTLKSL
ncbi:aspartate aminotransferase family protein [Candidatus Methanoperedens nitratireducens]|uniref:Class III aminotransferase n=1 Tax=Candidatus Methanoperedens nitratireducens TaxID=1392998 RepID=A0A284VM67_9EURY|nr:aminotransferase class III-fold pyridoxal phosphate-dependent enzyme [Candidatus Methanoperedens nitroreducens]SNQ60365.1 Class III aminotransferase [Candidatus Methanoperedens nitroreducens]